MRKLLAILFLVATPVFAGPCSPAPILSPGTPILCIVFGSPYVVVCGISQ